MERKQLKRKFRGIALEGKVPKSVKEKTPENPKEKKEKAPPPPPIPVVSDEGEKKE